MLDAAGERPVTFRTLDIGGDKVLPYMKGAEEENPALGWRAIRIGLDRPALLRTADARDAARRRRAATCAIMLPMVSTVDEFDAARALLDRELAFAERCGRTPPRSIELGVMVEVPSLLWQLDEIADARRFPVGRLQRSHAISLRRRPRQQARRRTGSTRCRPDFCAR